MENSDEVVARVDLPAGPERVFRALTTAEICDWWVRPGVFDTRTWSGDISVGGRWETTGVGRMGPYRMIGEFVEIEAPRRLVHTWTVVGAPGGVSTVAYDIEATSQGASLTLRHAGLTVPPIREATAAGWETSLDRLAQLLQG
jgi:uncharacterized protein YndB with AHSA1/START domain